MTISTIARNLGIGVAASTLLLCAQAQAITNPGTITGVVKNQAGQPVVGAFVRLKNADKRLSFMVVSQPGGTYTASDLPAGQYTVQGIGGDNQALVAEKCTVCHDVQRILSKRSPVVDWEFTIKRMRTNMATASLPDITDADAAAIVKYTSANFKPLPGGDDINGRLPNVLATGASLKYRVVTLDLPRRYSEPHDIASDPSGVGWAAERAGALIRFDPKTYDFAEVRVPAGPAPADRQRLGNPQINAQGILWTADGPNNRWLSYDTKAYSTANPQAPFHIYLWNQKGHGGAGGNSFALHPDGTVWGTGMGKEVRMLNPATAEFKFYEAPSYQKTKESPGAYGLAIAGDGSVWWAEDDADMMARADPKT